HVSRIAPTSRREEMTGDIGRAISKKARTLMRYPHLPGVLLLDYCDLSLLNEFAVAETFREAADSSTDLRQMDEVFIVDSGKIGPNWTLPVKIGTKLYPDLDEFQRYREIQYEMSYG